MDVIENCVRAFFCPGDWILHELVSPDIHVDILVCPPVPEKDCFSLVTMGMGAHRMNLPPRYADSGLDRAELAVQLPSYWKLDDASLKNESWYWPICMLKDLARLPVQTGEYLACGHT